MSDFTVFDVAFPAEARQRVIVNTDAKNEADDQYAIVHAVLTPSFELHGIIPAHYGTRKTPTSLRESHDETVKLLCLMDLEGQVRIEDGAPRAIPDESPPAFRSRHATKPLPFLSLVIICQSIIFRHAYAITTSRFSSCSWRYPLLTKGVTLMSKTGTYFYQDGKRIASAEQITPVTLITPHTYTAGAS